MYQEFPKWLYSKDHGSVVVDTPEQVLSLPGIDWYATPDFSGFPAVSLTKPNYVETDGNVPVDKLQPGVAQQQAIDAALAKIEGPETVRLDKRSKEWRDSQVPK